MEIPSTVPTWGAAAVVTGLSVGLGVIWRWGLSRQAVADDRVKEAEAKVDAGMAAREKMRSDLEARLDKQVAKNDDLEREFRGYVQRTAPLLEKAVDRILPPHARERLRDAPITMKLEACSDPKTGALPKEVVEAVQRMMAEGRA